MRMRASLIVAAIVSTAVLALATTASAGRFFLSNLRQLEIWPQLTFRAGGGVSISCPVTVEGSFHSSTITKTSGLLVGYVYDAKVATPSCTGGRIVFDTETLPWHLRYLGYDGNLPNITNIYIKYLGLTFDWEVSGTRCRTQTTAREPAVSIINLQPGTGGNFIARTLRANEAAAIELRGGFLCELAGRGNFSGTGEVFLRGSLSTRILVRLVQ